VIAPPEPLSLRLSSNLMVGITRIYGQQCLLHLQDAQHLWSRLLLSHDHYKEQALSSAGDHKMEMEHGQAGYEEITLQERRKSGQKAEESEASILEIPDLETLLAKGGSPEKQRRLTSNASNRDSVHGVSMGGRPSATSTSGGGGGGDLLAFDKAYGSFVDGFLMSGIVEADDNPPPVDGISSFLRPSLGDENGAIGLGPLPPTPKEAELREPRKKHRKKHALFDDCTVIVSREALLIDQSALLPAGDEQVLAQELIAGMKLEKEVERGRLQQGSRSSDPFLVPQPDTGSEPLGVDNPFLSGGLNRESTSVEYGLSPVHFDSVVPGISSGNSYQFNTPSGKRALGESSPPAMPLFDSQPTSISAMDRESNLTLLR